MSRHHNPRALQITRQEKSEKNRRDRHRHVDDPHDLATHRNFGGPVEGFTGESAMCHSLCHDKHPSRFPADLAAEESQDNTVRAIGGVLSWAEEDDLRHEPQAGGAVRQCHVSVIRTRSQTAHITPRRAPRVKGSTMLVRSTGKCMTHVLHPDLRRGCPYLFEQGTSSNPHQRLKCGVRTPYRLDSNENDFRELMRTDILHPEQDEQ